MVISDEREWTEDDISSLGADESSRGADEESEDDESETEEGEEDDEESDDEEESEEDDSDEDEDEESDVENSDGWTDEDGLSTDWEDTQQTSGGSLVSGSDDDDDDEEGTDSDEEEDSEHRVSPVEAFDDEPWGKADMLEPTFEQVHGAAPRNIDEEAGLMAPSASNEKKKKTFRSVYSGSNKRILDIICCACVLIVILGVVIGIVTGGGGDDEPATSRDQATTEAPVATLPTTAAPIAPTPTEPPTSMPVTTKVPDVTTESPSISPAPTGPIPEEIILLPNADTYIETGILEDVGAMDTLLVQSDTSFALISFNITTLPEPNALLTREKTAMLRLTHIASDATDNVGNATLRVSRLPSTPLSVETLTSGNFVPAGGTMGPNFTVAPADTFVEVDITDLLFGQAPFVRQSQTTQLFLMVEGLTLEGETPVVDSRFQSRESDMPPELVVGLELASPSPTVTAAPTVTYRPSLRPSISPAPSLSSSPTSAPSESPSGVPTISSHPTMVPTEQSNETLSSLVPSIDDSSTTKKPSASESNFTLFPTATNTTKKPTATLIIDGPDE